LISHLQPFGSLCYIHIPEDRRPAGSKLHPRAERAMFIGYTESPYIYKVQQLATKHMFTVQAANCTFIPNKSTNPQNPQPTNPQPTNPQPTNPQPINQQSNPQSSNSQSTNSDANSDETTYPHTLLATALAVSESEPKTFKQATSCSDAPRWYTAMQEELDLMKEQNV